MVLLLLGINNTGRDLAFKHINVTDTEGISDFSDLYFLTLLRSLVKESAICWFDKFSNPGAFALRVLEQL